MAHLPSWANLAVIDIAPNGGCSLETLFVTDEETALTGAWYFEDKSDPDISLLIQDRLVLKVDPAVNFDFKKYQTSEVHLNDFVEDARVRTLESVRIFDHYVTMREEEYKAYMAIPPAERKALPKVVKRKFEPFYFNDWSFQVDLKNPAKTLEQLGKRSLIDGTPKEMFKVNTFSRLIKYLLEKWKEDESERFARKFMDESFQEFKILPETWLQIQKQKD